MNTTPFAAPTPRITVTTQTIRRLGPVALVITRTGTPGQWITRTRVVWAR
jgi:hypothetical protein